MRVQLSRRSIVEKITREIIAASGGIPSVNPDDTSKMPYPNYAKRADLPEAPLNSIAFIQDEGVFVTMSAEGWVDTGIKWTDITASFATKSELSTKADVSHNHDTVYSKVNHSHEELHAHTNKEELDRIGINESNILTVDGVEIAVSGEGEGDSVSTAGGSIPIFPSKEEFPAPTSLGQQIIAADSGIRYNSTRGGLGENTLPTLTANEQDGYVISASTSYGAAYPYRIADGTTSGWRPTSLPGWNLIELPEARELAGFTLTAPSNVLYTAKSFKAEVSIDGEVWETVFERSNETSWKANEVKVYEFTGGFVTAKYFRLTVSEANGSYAQITELALFNPGIVWDEPYYTESEIHEILEGFALKSEVAPIYPTSEAFPTPKRAGQVAVADDTGLRYVSEVGGIGVDILLGVTGELNAGITVSASSGSAANALTTNLTSGWRAYETPAWWRLDFVEEKSISAIALTPGSNNTLVTKNSPKDFTVSISNDGVEWETVLTKTGVSDWVISEKKVYVLDKPVITKFVKLDVIADNGAEPQINQVELLSTGYEYRVPFFTKKEMEIRPIPFFATAEELPANPVLGQVGLVLADGKLYSGRDDGSGTVTWQPPLA